MGGIYENKISQYVESLILNGALEGNILPLTSSCNMRCIFCSHRQNPAGVQVYRIAHRSLSEVKQTLSYMDPLRPVVIGESVTRIIEGEPFTHPLITEILQLIRSSLPAATIKITTNGCLLDQAAVETLSQLDRVVVNLSLNSASELGRGLLMGDSSPNRSLKSAVLLQEYGVSYHGSVVAMPHVTGWMDLKQTITWLSSHGAETIRVFLPGYSELAASSLRFESSLWEQLNLFVTGLRGKVSTPITCEPPAIHDLLPVVTGVIAGSPATRAGVRSGDVVVKINGTAALSRVHAFNQVLSAPFPAVTLNRNGETINIKIAKEQDERSGLVMDYDVDPELIKDIARLVRQHRAEEVLLGVQL